MQIIIHPDKKNWKAILGRPVIDAGELDAAVRNIMESVKQGGDKALFDFSLRLDKAAISSLEISEKEIKFAGSRLDPALRNAIVQAAENIRKFHSKQAAEELKIETMPGVICWRKSVGIEKVGLYIPGGSAPLFSTVLMLGIPASLAGCREIIVCTPPDKEGRIDPAILFACELVGATKIFRVGGAQAIAAMVYGTETIPAVYKIFGPGNQYVTAAKQRAQMEGVAIDMPAGPSEVCVLADETAVPEFVAADLLSQAEHGPDSQALLICTSEFIAKRVRESVMEQLKKLPRGEIASKSLGNSRLVVLQSLELAIEMVNEYAPEHLILSCREDEKWAESIRNAGSIFLGNYSPESVGDYASGTNHTLPTHGFARVYSGVSVDSFVKKITLQKLSRKGLELIAPIVEAMSMAEGLEAHAEAVRIRVNQIAKAIRDDRILN